MRVLVLSNSVIGIILFRIELLHALVDDGNVVRALLPDDESKSQIEDMGVSVVITPIDRRGINPFKDARLLFSYIHALRSFQPEVVLTYTIKPNVYGGIACRLMRIPYLVNVTGLGTAIENGGFISKLALFLYKRALKHAKCVFFQNKANLNQFLNARIIRTKTKLIPGSGVNLTRHPFEDYPIEENAIKFLFIGRIMKAKGIDEYLEAAQIILKNNPYVEFHIIGECEEDYRLILKDLGNAGIISYHGMQKDVHPFIKKMHATIQPSYHEGTSNVLLESAASGRPVLATRVPGCIETFDEGISGIGFEARSTDALVAAIQQFIDLPHETKRQMGVAGRRKMEREFDRQIVIDSYLEEIVRIKEQA